MWHVIVMILKIIGIILLAVLGIALFLVLSVMFVPVRYRVEAKKQEEICVHAKLTWLLHLLSLPISYENGETKAYLKVSGFKVKDFMEESPEETGIQEEVCEQETVHSEAPAVQGEKPAEEPGEEPMEAEPDKEPVLKEGSPYRKKRKKFSIKRIVSEIWEKLKKLKYTICEFCDTIKKGIQRAGSFKEFLLLESTRTAFSSCWTQLVFLLKRISPRRIRGWIHFGMEDPALTRQILGGISVFFGCWPRKLKLQPDFQQQVLEGEVDIRGHLHLITAVKIIWKIWRDENIKTAYTTIKRGF